ncbi:MAG TPA: hypothetical protein VNE59_09695 [Burkholderiales bacterium]|nr:hypothetical protein [Burkholderiales bacterium]
MITLVGLSGSLRRASYNSALLRAAAAATREARAKLMEGFVAYVRAGRNRAA